MYKSFIMVNHMITGHLVSLVAVMLMLVVFEMLYSYFYLYTELNHAFNGGIRKLSYLALDAVWSKWQPWVNTLDKMRQYKFYDSSIREPLLSSIQASNDGADNQCNKRILMTAGYLTLYAFVIGMAVVVMYYCM